jgi:hypothetical protein
MNVLACDPGSAESAYVLLKGGVPVKFGKLPNEALLRGLDGGWNEPLGETPQDVLAIEYVRLRGMPVMQQVLDTMFWTGRFVEAWDGPWSPVDRLDVKMTLCGDSRAKDGNIRVAVIDHYGGEAATKGPQKCGVCNGRGSHRCLVCRGGPKARLSCSNCHTAGRSRCEACGATGISTPAGILHGMAGDCWQALAIALTWLERNGNHD